MGNNQPKISVIMPVYNASRYLGESLGNVIRQTFSDIEIICVDDGSTDDSLDILRRYENEDDRIRVISCGHTNAGTARNTGLAEAKGEYLSFLDADDIFEPDLLTKAYETATTKQADIVAYRSDRYNETRGAYEEACWTIKRELLPKQYYRGECFSHKDMDDILYCFASGWAWDKLFRADHIRSQGLKFQEQPWINDRYFVMCAIAAAERIYVIDDVLVHKRVNNRDSLTTEYVDEGKWRYWFNAIEAIYQKLLDLDIYNSLMKDYISFASYYVLWNLDVFLDDEGYSEMFVSIRREWLKRLSLDGLTAADFYRQTDYDLLELIRKQEPADYRFIRRLSRRNGNYLFPFETVKKGARIILYGAGVVGQEYYRQLRFSDWCDVALWIDSNPDGKAGLVFGIEKISDVAFDSLVIAIRDREMAEHIRTLLLDRGVSSEKIVWRSPEIEL